MRCSGLRLADRRRWSRPFLLPGAGRLRESNRLLARLRDANIIGVAVLTEAGVREANDADLDIIGYTRDNLESEGGPDAAAHLEQAIRTGSRCSYAPSRPSQPA